MVFKKDKTKQSSKKLKISTCTDSTMKIQENQLNLKLPTQVKIQIKEDQVELQLSLILISYLVNKLKHQHS